MGFKLSVIVLRLRYSDQKVPTSMDLTKNFSTTTGERKVGKFLTSNIYRQRSGINNQASYAKSAQ